MTLTDARPSSPGTISDQESAPTVGRAAGWLVTWIRGYQLLRTGRPTGCRFIPTCSEYAIEAIRTKGAFGGGRLAARRLLRCGPWGGQGYDPIPDGGDPCTHH